MYKYHTSIGEHSLVLDYNQETYTVTMKSFLVLASLLIGTYGQYLYSPWVSTPIVRSYDWTSLAVPRVVPVAHSPVVAPVAPVHYAPVSISTSSQYHSQDELGQFAFGHRGDNQARDEVKSFDGTVRGAYSYVDPTGKLVNVQYLADHNGFRVLGANNLPEAPALPAPVELVGPEPVKDTPEVIAARSLFEKQFAEAAEKAGKEPVEEVKVEEKKEEEKSRKKRDLYLTSPFVHSYPYVSPYASPYLAHAPLVAPVVSPVVPLAKTTIKTSELKPIDDAKTPAATKKADIEEKEREIVSPLGSWILPQTRTIVLSKDEKKEIFAPLPLSSLQHSILL